MNEMRIMLFIIVWLLGVSEGCAVHHADRTDGRRADHGQLTIFLNGPDKASEDITFTIKAATLIAENGASLELLAVPLTIKSELLTGRQILMGEYLLPEEEYWRLQIVIADASIRKKGRIASLALPKEIIEIPARIQIEKKRNTTIFITWNVDASLTGEIQFTPDFSVRGQAPELSSLLIYVTNEESDNVSVINKNSGKVVGTVLVGRRPRGVAAGLLQKQRKIYVANSNSDSVSVIDPVTNMVENEIPIRFGREPESIAVAGISAQRELIFVANHGSDTVSIIDGQTLQETEKINVGSGPAAIAADPPIEDLTGHFTLGFDDLDFLRSYRERYLNVYVANRNSNDVSVLRIDALSGRCEDTVTVNVEWSPAALAVDYRRGKVYVANYGSDRLSIIDILQVIRGNAKRAVNSIGNIGPSLAGIVPDPSLDRIYAVKENADAVLILRPFLDDLGAFALSAPVVGMIPVGSAPRAVALDAESGYLYTANQADGTVSVISRTARMEEKVIPVGKRPYGFALFGRAAAL